MTPIPLATRASIGRVASGVMAFAVLLSGFLGAIAPTDDVVLPLPVLIGLSSTFVVVFGSLAASSWHRRLSPPVQERVLLTLVLLPTIGVLATFAGNPADADSLLFLAVVFATAALTISLQRFAVLSGLVLATIAVLAVTADAVADTAYDLVVLAAVAALSGFSAWVIGQALGTATAREREAEASRRSLMAVVEAARTATTADSADVLHAVAAATAQLESDTAGVYLMGPDGLLYYGAAHNIPAELRGERFSPDNGMAGLAWRTGEFQHTNDYQTEHAGMGSYKSVGLRAATAVPIRVHDEVVGVLVAGRYRAGGYEQSELTAFELLADHAGRALALSQAIDEDRRLVDRLRSLRTLQQDFVATVSHELRTPLTVIDGLAETIQRHRSRMDEEQTDALFDRLRANTSSLSRILTSLLDTARLDRGLIEVDGEDVPVTPMLRGCVERLSPLLVDHVVELNAGDDVTVRGDAALLERVVDNLLTNAERHTPAGTRVTVSAEVLDGTCTISVTDDGPGIGADDLERITDRFTRGGDHHTRTTRGLGLGLALADQVLRLHGSRLLVRSAPGSGATFLFRLPLVHDQEAAAQNGAPADADVSP